MRVALIGTPNCGKTTLFNAMTGSNYRVANRPGVTVERREGVCRIGKRSFTLIDLPGLYSLTPYTEEEQLAISCLKDGEADAILCIVDALSPEKGFSLLKELAGLSVPVTVAWARIDLAKLRGIEPDLPGLTAILGVPVILVSGQSGEGLTDLTAAILDGEGRSVRGKNSSGLSKIADLSPEILESYAGCAKDRGKMRAKRLDRLFLHPIWGLPCLLAILGLLLTGTFALGGRISGWMEGGFAALSDRLGEILRRAEVWMPLQSLILEGILPAALSVLTFLPDLTLLYLGLGILEDSGYLSRASCVWDAILSRRGLSGRAAVPLLLGLGCTVPAVLSTRTLEGREDRIRAMERIPFLPCSAKLPVFLVISRAFFGRWAWILPTVLYSVGIGIAVLGRFGRAGEAEYPLICELPDYQMPHGKTVWLFARDRVLDCLRRVATVIFLSSILLWAMTYYNLEGRCLPEDSMLAAIGRRISPLLIPCGLSDWRVVPAILAGFWGKELILSTLAILCESDIGTVLIGAGWTWVNGVSLLIFVLLSPPCVAAFTAIRRERGSVWGTVVQTVRQLALAWLGSTLVYQFLSAMT